MLQFFRRHQKILFIVVTFVVVVSFCFFGTYGTMSQPEGPADYELGKGVSGQAIKSREFMALCRLLESSVLDRASKEGLPNLLNPGVIEKEFLSTGLGLMLVKPYFSEMKKELDERVKKIHNFRPYVHPKSSEVSAEWVWGVFSTSFAKRYQLLKSRSDQATTESFALMNQLYVDQLSLPPSHTLKQILVMQQNGAGLDPDPLLEQADLSLFGFKSLEDWFGPKFVPLVAGFVLNAAQSATALGIEVKTDEVREDLLKNIYQGYQQLTRNEKMTSEEVNQYYLAKMRGMGLDEAGLLHAWKQVMLFRKLLEEAGSQVQMDSLVYQQFDQFAKESVEVDLYQLPKALQFSDFLSMLKFQLYIEGISQEGVSLRKTGALPVNMASIEHIEKRSPQFVESLAEVEWRSVTREELEGSISLKETLNWELLEENWSLLQKMFPSLEGQAHAEVSQRLSLLNRLSGEERAKVDAFARAQMVSSQPERLVAALQLAPVKTVSLGLRPGADFVSALGMQENGEILSLLKTASLKGEEPNASSQRLHSYTPDQKHLYVIDVLSRQDEKQILTLAQATQDGTLDRLLNQVLEAGYPDVRKKHPSVFKTTAGEWKPLEQVKEPVGRYLFADLLKAVEEGYCAKGGSLPAETTPLSFYSDARFFALMDEAKQRLASSAEAIPSLLSQQSDDPLAAQWLLQKEPKQLTRSTQTLFPNEELFSLGQNQWSKVKVGVGGSLSFCLMKQKGKGGELPIEGAEQGHQILSQDARKDLMVHLLQKMHTEKGLNLLSYLRGENP